MSIIAIDKEYVAGTYGRFPVELVSGEGSCYFGSDGKRYIDMGSGIGVTSVGFKDAAWLTAVTEQLNTLQHTSNLYYTAPCANLAKVLCEKTGMKKVFFSNSGAEANECAIKVARKYSAEKKGAQFHTIVTLVNSFHGRTLTTLSATGQDHFHELFQPLTPGFVHVAAGDMEGLKKVVEQIPVAGIMMEVVQGEGGVVPLSAEFVTAAAALAKQNDIDVLILCGGSATDLPVQSPEWARCFNIVDSFDNHSKIPEHFAAVDAAACESGKVGIISVGWDPGMFSLNRMYANAAFLLCQDSSQALHKTAYSPAVTWQVS